jgi:hypothetical protein
MLDDRGIGDRFFTETREFLFSKAPGPVWVLLHFISCGYHKYFPWE